MLKKVFLSSVLLVFVFLAAGCGTLYKGAQGITQGIKEGAQEDWHWLVKQTNSADSWCKENLW